MALLTLKKRSEFLRIRGGARASGAAFAIEARRREPAVDSGLGPRFGFTITKKIGGAVVRNRIRRRLKAALCEVAPGRARDQFDYVVFARPLAADLDYADLKSQLARALDRLHGASDAGAGLRSPRASVSDAERRGRMPLSPAAKTRQTGPRSSPSDESTDA